MPAQGTPSSVPRTVRLGIDVGGTFTDIVSIPEDGSGWQVIKVPSTPRTPDIAVLRAIDAMLEAQGDVRVGFVGHGTTAATNAFLTKRGAVTVLLTTKGFEDVLEFRRMDRTGILDPYDLQLAFPAPVVPARRRFGVDERIGRDGEVVVPLDEIEIERVVELVRDCDAEAVAISLLWAFENPVHERKLRDTIAELFPSMFVTCSSEIDPNILEYERTSTTVINAYVGPLIDDYFSRVAEGVDERGLPEPRIMQSNGGLASIQEAGRRPVSLLESGPAAGVSACAALGETLGVTDIMAVDMGGTSFDVALILNGQPRRMLESEVHGYVVRTPMLDIRSIGAGGGSIAWIDDGGALRVGPHSAGSEPGPVCYGKGGLHATVSDANAVLGYLQSLTGGTFTLDVDAARAIIDEQIGQPLGLDSVAAAHAVYRLANAHMADAMRVMSTEAAASPAGLTLMVYGGAGPVHGASLAREIGIGRTVIPAHPGAFSALGVATGDLVHDLVDPVMKPLDVLDASDLQDRFERMRRDGEEILRREGAFAQAMEFEFYIVARYIGQMHDLQVPVIQIPENNAGMEELLKRFHVEHQATYGLSVEDEPVMLVSARARALARIPKPRFDRQGKSKSPKPIRKTFAWFEDLGEVEVPVYVREAWQSDVQSGPAIIQEYDSTTVVLTGQTWQMDETGSIIIQEES